MAHRVQQQTGALGRVSLPIHLRGGVLPLPRVVASRLLRFEYSRSYVSPLRIRGTPGRAGKTTARGDVLLPYSAFRLHGAACFVQNATSQLLRFNYVVFLNVLYKIAIVISFEFANFDDEGGTSTAIPNR